MRKGERGIKEGYILVNANYAFAPEYRFPTQIEQVNELLSYLLANADDLHIDTEHICLSGASAGAIMTVIYATAMCNSDYASNLGIDPIATKENIKVLAIDEAVLDSRNFNNDLYTMMLCWINENSKSYRGNHVLLNVTEQIKDSFIPSWINASNVQDCFEKDGECLSNKLKEIGVPFSHVYFNKSHGDLPHGYMELMDGNECSITAFRDMINFINSHI